MDSPPPSIIDLDSDETTDEDRSATSLRSLLDISRELATRRVHQLSSDSSNDEPPRRRVRLDSSHSEPERVTVPFLSNPGASEAMRIRDCLVNLPRMRNESIVDSHPVPSSSNSTRHRMATRSTHSHSHRLVSPYEPSSSDPGPNQSLSQVISQDSNSDSSSNLSTEVRGSSASVPTSSESEVEVDVDVNWSRRRLVRRNAIFRDEDAELGPELAVDEGGEGDIEDEVDLVDDDFDLEGDEDEENALDALFQQANASDHVYVIHDSSTNDNISTTSVSDDSSVSVPISTETQNVVAVESVAPIGNFVDSTGGPLYSLLHMRENPVPAVGSSPMPGPSTGLDDSVKSADDDEGMTCLICYEHFTNSGEHRITCLKCGHTYGKACIEKWIRNEKRCPQCNAKAVRKDIRVLYVKNLKAIDTVERDKLMLDLEKEKESKRKLELECARLRQMNQCRNLDFVKLEKQLTILKERVGGIYRDPGASSSSETLTSTNESKGFTHTKYLEFKDGEFRVGAYNQWLNMTAISQTLKSPLYPQGCFGIKRINMLDLKYMQTTPIHQKEIRDLQFNKIQNDLLLSVGMDKKAMLTNCQSNVIVQSFQTPQPLWSCTWSSLSQHLFYVGTSNGQIITYDLRNPQDSVSSFTVPSDDMSPIARMHFISPSYQNQSSAFSLSGLLIQKLNSCWFCEIKNEKQVFHQLPIEGSFSSIDFEPKSRLMLLSTRPSAKSPGGRHLVCELNQYYSEAQECNICSCNVVQTFESGPLAMGKMTRSSIFSPIDGTVLVGGNAGKNVVNLWNVSDLNKKQTINTREPILDFVPSEVNDKFLLNMVTNTGLHVYTHQQ